MFELTATAALCFATIFWSQTGNLNKLCKFAYLALSMWGVFETADAFGFIVAAP